MSTAARKALYWTPRVLCICFALFLSLFALDVFEGGRSVGQVVVALLIHLIPVYIVLAVTAISWRWEWIGAVLFAGLGIFYIVMAWGRVHPTAFFAISGPAFLIGAMFLANWVYREEIRARKDPAQA